MVLKVMKTGPKSRTRKQVWQDLLASVTINQGCFIPKKKPMPSGYIQVLYQGTYDYAHRLAYLETVGNLPDNVVVRHSCHNKNCINPAHLSIGTHADNVNDKVLAKRHGYGEKHYKSKLTEKDVLYIRAHPELSLQKLADKFDVGRGTIQQAREGKTWKHL